jgi:predicted LPLAT superfamily acyltransferase
MPDAMPQWQGKSKGNKVGYQIFVFLCRTFGVWPAYLLLFFVALYYFLFSYKSSRHSFSYFRKRQKFGVFKSLLFVYWNYYRFGQTLIDKIIIMTDVKNPFTFELDGVENLEKIVALNQGGILLSGHAGNWEIAGHMLKTLQARVNVVMFDGEHQQIKEYLEEVSGTRSFNVIVIREDMSHVYQIGEALQKNELVCLHADRFVQDVKTVARPFLGGSAKFPSGPFAIASTFNAPVSFVYAFKETATHYHLYGSPGVQRSGDVDKRAYAEMLAVNFVSSFEKMVRKYPDQWFNYYNFWEE